MILDYLNFPVLNTHRKVCKYGPHLDDREYIMNIKESLYTDIE